MYQHIAESTREIAHTARRLAAGECGAGYYEASSIISNVLSAISAILWPEDDKTTRKRFVETLARHANPNCRTTFVSIPLLTADLIASTENVKRELGVELRSKMLPPLDDHIVTGEDIDVACGDLTTFYPQLKNPEVRKFSYANLLYREVRCGLVHTYSLGKSTSPFPLTG